MFGASFSIQLTICVTVIVSVTRLRYESVPFLHSVRSFCDYYNYVRKHQFE